MHAIHERCVQEAKEEQQGKVNRDGQEPARLFCHGLPGSGKTQVMKWMAEYFEEVWGWVAGRHYVKWFINNPFLANQWNSGMVNDCYSGCDICVGRVLSYQAVMEGSWKLFT